jgi:hypothetical protein
MEEENALIILSIIFNQFKQEILIPDLTFIQKIL